MADATQRATQAEVIRVTENPLDVAELTPVWTWCPMPGMSTTATLAVETVAFGDGYIHRATRGLNPLREQWTMAFPFVSQTELQTMNQFLKSYATGGFWMLPPDFPEYVFVCAETWSWSIQDRTGSTFDVVGTLQATFTRSFNPQPVSDPP